MSKKKKKNNTLDDEKIKVEKVKTDNKKDISKTIEIKESTVEKKITSSENKSKTSKRKSSLFLNLLVALVLLSGGCYFITSLLKFNSLGDIVNGLLLLGVSIFFVAATVTNPSKKKGTSYLALILLFFIQLLGTLVNYEIVAWPTNTIGNFVGKSLTDVIEWTNKNNIELIQEYEYSDLIPEYHIIYQNKDVNTKISKIKKLKVAISEGPSPYKDVVLPNMIGWNTDDVLKFIKDNHLTNVLVDFVKDNSKINTLIEQSETGNIKRNDEVKFIFSYGEERSYSEVKIIDLTDMSTFDAEFYLKQYGIKYEFDYDFSDTIERGHVIKQDALAGSMVSISGDGAKLVKVTISKGPKIIVPDLKAMTLSEITEWVIKNNLKIEFKDRYDDTVLENGVADANYKKDDIVEEGTLIIITVSKGKLVMEKFESYSQFREWADTYGIKYEEKHEFNNDIPTGEVVKYSYEVGSTIKNGDVVIVTISDGKKISVPNVVGITKDQATNKLRNAGLGYSFVYKYDNNVAKGKSISQSIRAGSEVSQGTTVTVTISNGVKPVSNTGNSKPTTTPSTPACVKKTYTVGRNLNNIFANYSGFDTVKSQLVSFFANNYPNVKINVIAVDGGDATSGSYIGGIGPGSTIESCNSSAYTIKLAK